MNMRIRNGNELQGVQSFGCDTILSCELLYIRTPVKLSVSIQPLVLSVSTQPLVLLCGTLT